MLFTGDALLYHPTNHGADQWRQPLKTGGGHGCYAEPMVKVGKVLLDHDSVQCSGEQRCTFIKAGIQRTPGDDFTTVWYTTSKKVLTDKRVRRLSHRNG